MVVFVEEVGRVRTVEDIRFRVVMERERSRLVFDRILVSVTKKVILKDEVPYQKIRSEKILDTKVRSVGSSLVMDALASI